MNDRTKPTLRDLEQLSDRDPQVRIFILNIAPRLGKLIEIGRRAHLRNDSAQLQELKNMYSVIKGNGEGWDEFSHYIDPHNLGKSTPSSAAVEIINHSRPELSELTIRRYSSS